VADGTFEPVRKIEAIDRTTRTSPRLKARIAGALWLLVMAGGMAGFVINSGLMVRGDAAATADRILASETLFRAGFTANLLAGVCYVGVTVLLYDVLKPVSRVVSLLAAFFGLGGVAIGGVGYISNLAPLVLLKSAPDLTAFTLGQIQAMALIFLRLYAQSFNMGMLLFGCQCALAGWLIVRSTFLPRVLGVLLAAGGLSYVVSSIANFLSPAFGASVSPYILPAVFLGEGSLSVWLTAAGVNASRWEEQAAAVAP